jgi:hypothetical protein
MADQAVNLDLDYQQPAVKEPVRCPHCGNNLTKDERPNQLSNVELSANYIRHAVGSSHPKGIEGQQRRIWGRIDRAIDAAMDNGTATIDIEQAGVDFLKKAFKDCTVEAHIVKYFVVLEEELSQLN